MVSDREVIDDITAYVSGLTAARDAISLVVADFVLAQDTRRCAGASRAYGSVDALIAAQVLKSND
ncbi:hypothetical protein ACFQ9V_17625 [Leifsonia sp. NPDC056665]|uniref:hypothetical protein n=1 Tax=Leifsonia sp. NPDC056665 TaxID=3345901 RepID=UPI0036A108D2